MGIGSECYFEGGEVGASWAMGVVEGIGRVGFEGLVVLVECLEADDVGLV